MTEQQTTPRKRVRSAQSDRMGFAWEPEELPDMTVEEARAILAELDDSRAMGSIGNEYQATYDYARLLLSEAKGNG